MNTKYLALLIGTVASTSAMAATASSENSRCRLPNGTVVVTTGAGATVVTTPVAGEIPACQTGTTPPAGTQSNPPAPAVPTPAPTPVSTTGNKPVATTNPPATTSRMDDPAGLTGRPGTMPNILKLNKFSYAPGDAVQITVSYPAEIQSIWNGEAMGNVVVYLANGQPVSVALPAIKAGITQQVLDMPTLDTNVLPAGTYQISLVLTKPGGDALKLSDWYAGFRSLVTIAQFRILPGKTTTPASAVETEDGFGPLTPVAATTAASGTGTAPK